MADRPYNYVSIPPGMITDLMVQVLQVLQRLFQSLQG